MSVPLSDGAELRANVVLPNRGGIFPTLLYYVPYHKDDFVGANFEVPIRFFANHGYASVLVDARGTGSSGGRAWAPFDSVAESSDAAQAVEWTAAQPWCDGRVGMWGVSYGGFTALHTAARRPPHLRAIATVFGIQDPYLDFVAPGGILNMLGNWMRETHMVTMDLAPPGMRDPEGRWRRLWLDRLRLYGENGPRSFAWFGHQADDAYWRRLSIPVESITAKTFVIGGWRDLFAAGMIRVYERLRCRKRLLMGPWTHVHPYLAANAPIDWLDELRRWWEQTLRADGDGGSDRATVFLMGRGSWLEGEDWPGGTSVCELDLTAGEPRTYQVDPRTGISSGLWDPLGSGIGAPEEQSHDDARCWTATGDVLTDPVLLAGRACVRLRLDRVEGIESQLVVKLNDVDGCGRSELVSAGYLPHVEGPFPRKIEIELDPACHEFAAGHRLRVSVSGSDFPRVWPAPTNAIFSFTPDPVRVSLPIPSGVVRETRPPAAPDPGPKVPQLLGTAPHWTWEEDPLRSRVRVETGNLRRYRLADGTHYRIAHRARAEVCRDQPAAARLTTSGRIQVDGSEGGSIVVAARGSFQRGGARLRATVSENGRPLLQDEWRTRAS